MTEYYVESIYKEDVICLWCRLGIWLEVSVFEIRIHVASKSSQVSLGNIQPQLNVSLTVHHELTILKIPT